MAQDLFVALSNNKYTDVVDKVEEKVRFLVQHRHDYPIWPQHDSVMDAYEQDYHGSIRESYYLATIFMIQTLRTLRDIR